jgi:phosphoglycerate dehydrogenase-like enzyme
VLLTPHIAGASLNVIDHYSRLVVTALRALDGQGELSDTAIANPETLAGWIL